MPMLLVSVLGMFYLESVPLCVLHDKHFLKLLIGMVKLRAVSRVVR